MAAFPQQRAKKQHLWRMRSHEVPSHARIANPHPPFLKDTLISHSGRCNRSSLSRTRIIDAFAHLPFRSDFAGDCTHNAQRTMNGPATPSGTHYGRPPAYDDDDDGSPQLQGGSTMRLLTNVDDSQSYMP